MRPMQQTHMVIALLLVLMASLGQGRAPARAGSDPVSKADIEAIQKDLESIKTALGGIQKQLERIRELLVQRPAQPTRSPDVIANVSISGNPMLGNTEAPITLIEFSDYQCPYCSRFVRTALPTLKTEYIDTGKVRSLLIREW